LSRPDAGAAGERGTAGASPAPGLINVANALTVLRLCLAASRGGKAKTLLLVIAIALYILPGPFGVVRELVMAAALVVTVVTGADYAARAVRLRRATAHGPAGQGGAS
jgi:hypothetical protein